MKKILTSIMLFVLMSSSAFCEYPAKPNNPPGGTFSAGSILTSAQLNLWFSALYTWANGGIKDSNIASDSAISYSKLNISSSDIVSTLATASIPYAKLSIASSSIPTGLISYNPIQTSSFTSYSKYCYFPVNPIVLTAKSRVYFDGILQTPDIDYTIAVVLPSMTQQVITSTYFLASGTTVQIEKLD